MTYGRPEHLLLDARAGWRAATLSPTLRFGSDGVLRLRPQPGSLRPLADAAGSFGGLSHPTGLAVDDDGQIYVLDAGASVVKKFDPCCNEFTALSCVGGRGGAPRRLRDPRGLAVTPRGDLIVADTGNRRLQLFTLKGLALRSIIGPFKVTGEAPDFDVEPTHPLPPEAAPMPPCSPEEVEPTFEQGTWEPWDVVVARNGRTYVTDRENGLVHVFDSRGCWLRAFDGSGPDVPPLEKPTHIALDRECRLYVVQEGQPFVTVLERDGTFVEHLTVVDPREDFERKFCPTAVAVDLEGNLCVADRTSGRVYSFCRSGSGHAGVGAWRAFEGAGAGLAFDLAGNALVTDAGLRRVCRLEAAAAFELEGKYISETLDSRLYRCQWHSVALEATVPAGSEVRVETFSSESPKTAAEVEALPAARWSRAHVHTRGDAEWDCLVLSPPGRYLWLRLTLAGEGETTPELRAARVYFPRSSSLQFLPGVYSEDAAGRDFLDRFLSIFDRMWGDISEKVGNIASYFDPAATPADGPGDPARTDFLSWLASWLDLTLERHWPVAKRRRLLEQAHRLYRLRGTPEGLRLHLQLYTDVEPRLLEHFKLRRWFFAGHTRLGEQTTLWGRAVVRRLQLGEFSRIGEFQLIDSGDPLRDPFHQYAHRFTIFLPAARGLNETERRTVERIVEMSKPAHALAEVRFVEPRFRVGLQAFVGVDTVVGRYPDRTAAGEARLGYDSMLGPSEDESRAPTMRVGVRTRIGSSTLID